MWLEGLVQKSISQISGKATCWADRVLEAKARLRITISANVTARDFC